MQSETCRQQFEYQSVNYQLLRSGRPFGIAILICLAVLLGIVHQVCQNLAHALVCYKIRTIYMVTDFEPKTSICKKLFRLRFQQAVEIQKLSSSIINVFFFISGFKIAILYVSLYSLQ